MKLENGALHELKLNLPYPMRDHKVFLKLLLLDTEMHPPPAAIVGVSINCEPVKPRVLQTGSVHSAGAGAGEVGTDAGATGETGGSGKYRFAGSARHASAGRFSSEEI